MGSRYDATGIPAQMIDVLKISNSAEKCINNDIRWDNRKEVMVRVNADLKGYEVDPVKN